MLKITYLGLSHPDQGQELHTKGLIYGLTQPHLHFVSTLAGMGLALELSVASASAQVIDVSPDAPALDRQTDEFVGVWSTNCDSSEHGVVLINQSYVLTIDNLDQEASRNSDIDSLTNALQMYRLDNLNYPSAEQGLDALITEPSGAPVARNWRGPYLRSGPEVPWSELYQYVNHGNEFEIISLTTTKQRGISLSELESSWINDSVLQVDRSTDARILTYHQGTDASRDYNLCSGLPPKLSVLHGEAITFFQQSDALVLACSESGQACVETFFKQSDIAATGGINEADLSRLIRIGAYFGTLNDNGEARIADLVTAQAASIALAPLAANLLIRGFDYDGDGQLSIAEMAADRDVFAAANLPPMTGADSDLEDSLRSSVQQLQQLLMILQ